MNALDLLYVGLAAATSPWWARKARGDWAQRFGRTPPLPPPDLRRPRLLIHAVSVGEVNTLRQLVPLLISDHELVISVGTDRGIERARKLFSADCAVVRYPLDFSGAVDRFLDAVAPVAVALVELELWPNFIRACTRRSIPVAIINGRLSERSFRGYRRLRPLLTGMFKALRFAAVQDAPYAQRFESMGVAPQRCLITGSMKWDSVQCRDQVPAAAELAACLGIDRSRPLVVAGSTGPGEEALLHAATPPGVQLVCAPRLPERFEEAAAALPSCVRRSSRPAGSPAGAGAASDRYLLDTIGELDAAYSLADVAVVGRSFGSLYGSDPVEPVALGKATVIGPAVADFASTIEALAQAGGIVQTTAPQLGETLRSLLEDSSRRQQLAARGRACIAAQQGASQRHAALLRSLAASAVVGSPRAPVTTPPAMAP